MEQAFKKSLLGSMLLGALVFAPCTLGQTFPDRPIKMIIPFAAGGGADLIARPMSVKMSEAMGHAIIADYRDGASGAIGVDALLKSKADGYTILYGSNSVYTTGPLLNPNLRFVPERDLVPIALTVDQSYLINIHPSLPVRSLKELIDYAKANPGKVRYGSAGTGSITHLVAELFSSVAQVKMLHVPYKGSGPMQVDLLAGRIDMHIGGINFSQEHIRSGKLIGLAYAADKRSASLPDVPTTAEAGLPAYKSGSWYGVFAAAGTPRPAVLKLNSEIHRALGTPELRKLLAEAAVAPHPPELFAKYLKADWQRYEEVIKTNNIKIE